MSELPDNWTYATLESLGQWGSGGTPPRTNPAYFEGGKIPWLIIGDLNDRVVTNAATHITEAGLANSSAKLLPPETLLVAMYGSIGKLGITGIECATNQAIAFCKPNLDIASLRYLFYAVMNAKDGLVALGQGGAQQNISQGILKAYEIPLAPLSEQARIANKLDAVLARVDACRDRLDRIPAILKRFRQSVLAAATSGKLTENWRLQHRLSNETRRVSLGEDEVLIPDAWTISALKSVIDPNRPLCYGVVQPGDQESGGVPLIRVQDMDQRGGVLMEELRTVSHDVDAEYKRSRVIAGDLLISVVGTIGRTAIVPAGVEANIARAIARVACRVGVDSKWVNIWLSSEPLQWWLTSTSKEVARKTLNLSDLAEVKVAVPLLEEQSEIVRRVETLFAFANRLEARYTAARIQVEKLTPSLLAKAFRGELVPQDPNDEPASVLLERIASMRATTEVKPRRRQSTAGRKPTRAPKENAAVTKSRQDEDVQGKPYLAQHLRLLGGSASAEALFKVSELPVADFYKQLAWEVAQGHVRDGKTVLELADAA